MNQNATNNGATFKQQKWLNKKWHVIQGYQNTNFFIKKVKKKYWKYRYLHTVMHIHIYTRLDRSKYL